MKKHSLLLVFFLTTFSFTYAQEYVIGIKGGINYNNIGELYHYGPRGGNNVTPAEDTYYTAKKNMGYHFGIFFMVEYDQFFIRPEISYASLSNTYELAKADSQWTETKIDLGILFGYKVFSPISIYAGPIFSSINERDLEGNELQVKTPWVYKKTEVNVGIGLMADFGIVGIDLRYEYGLTKVDHQEINMVRAVYGTNRGALIEYNPSQIILSININALRFGGGKRNKKSGSGWRNHGNL